MKKYGYKIDHTEDGIATNLMEHGMDKKDIVLAFYSEARRKAGEFAVN